MRTCWPRANLAQGLSIGLSILLIVWNISILVSDPSENDVSPRPAHSQSDSSREVMRPTLGSQYTTPTQKPRNVDFQHAEVVVDSHSQAAAENSSSNNDTPSAGVSGRLLTGRKVEECKQHWSETIKDKYSLLVPMHGHVNYSLYFEHYSSSPKVDRLIIVWSNKGEEPPDWSMFPKVVTIRQETDDLVTRSVGALPIEYGLNNRFRPYKEIRTLAVFSVDNDMLIDMNYMDFVFDSWRLFPNHLVGFAIRIAKKSIEDKWEGLYEAHWPGWAAGHVPGHTLEYNMVYTNAAIFHRELLNDYTCSMPKEIREMVSEIRSCEDIAMNILSYAKWAAQPLGITTERRCVDNYGIAKQFKRDTGGLAKKGDMDTYALFRGKCYRRICEWLGTEIPLTTTTLKAYNDRQLCPDNKQH